MFKQVTIIGFGLIGSSLARAIRMHNLAQRIVCLDNVQAVCDRVIELGLADEATTNPVTGVRGSDLVILAVPVGACEAVASNIAASLEEGCIVTDVGSVKQSVIESVEPYIPDHAHFVPAHPIAGTEKSGPDAGFPELFINRWVIITPTPETDVQAVGKIVQLWEACGSVCEIMDPRHHDLILGVTSHLPHLIAYTIVGTADDLEDDIKNEVVKFSASGFRDFTRLAASNPVMWRDIFLTNKDAVLEMLQRFSEDLTALQKAIRKNDGRFLHDFFARTAHIRREVIEQGQATYVYPDKESQKTVPEAH
ncbi:MAG: prephenate/arogenate dehydrogenase family protein [Rhodospirillales bacterium]|nr:prephenate/arogenate dehydrogenase family protein [Rhodospirillales bacterium]